MELVDSSDVKKAGSRYTQEKPEGASIALSHCPFGIFTPEHGTGKLPGSSNTLQEPAAASISLCDQCLVDTFSLWSSFTFYGDAEGVGES